MWRLSLTCQEATVAIATERETCEPRIALHAEELSVSRHEVAGDVVQVQIVTKIRPHVINEDLTQERVEITRVPIGKFVEEVPKVREEANTTILPVVEEVIVSERKLLLREEIHVRRVRITERYTETVTLRYQEALATRRPSEQPIGGNDTQKPDPGANPTQPTSIFQEQDT